MEGDAFLKMISFFWQSVNTQDYDLIVKAFVAGVDLLRKFYDVCVSVLSILYKVPRAEITEYIIGNNLVSLLTTYKPWYLFNSETFEVDTNNFADSQLYPTLLAVLSEKVAELQKTVGGISADQAVQLEKFNALIVDQVACYKKTVIEFNAAILTFAPLLNCSAMALKEALLQGGLKLLKELSGHTLGGLLPDINKLVQERQP